MAHLGFGHIARFADFDACLCFEAGERTEDGDEAVIVKRKAAGTLRVEAHGRPAHSGSAPHRGRNALLALAAAAARGSRERPRRSRPAHAAVPTILRSGDAFNVVPATSELLCDLRADRLEALDPVLAAMPAEHDGVRLELAGARLAGDGLARGDRRPVAGAAERLGRPIVASERGGASDASHVAAGGIAVTLDGLGPRGGGAHAPHEWVSAESLRTRAELALAVMAALLDA